MSNDKLDREAWVPGSHPNADGSRSQYHPYEPKGDFMAFDPKRYDPDSANKARELLDEFRRPNREIVLPLARADRLEQAIADAIHDAKGK